MTTQPTVTGVDFGSNQVKIGAILKGGVQIITNQANFRQTPNVIGYGIKQRLVGEAGQVKIKSNHSNTVIAPNRYLGFNLNNEYTQQQLKFCPAKPRCSQQNQDALKFSLMQGEQRQNFTSEQLVATFLTQIQKIIAQTNNLSNKNMVITVPSYYSQHEKQALLNAVKIAQKKYKSEYSTQLVSEEIAASMDFGFGKRHEFEKEDSNAKNVLFIDFGHSKCNLFVTAFNNDHMKIIANKFNRQLGCKNIDQILLAFYANLFDSKNPSAEMNLMQNKKSVLKLLESIQRQRKVLSGVFEHDLSIQCILQDYDLAYTMKRDEFQKICEPVTQKLKQLLQQFLQQLKRQNIQINHIELIGGGTRIPIIIKSISQVFEVEPSRTLNSNECIARGAALISAMNSSIFKTHMYSYIEVSPYILKIFVNQNSETSSALISKSEFIPRQKQVQLNLKGINGKVQITVQYDELQKGIESKVLSFQVTLQQNKKEQQSQMKDQSEEVFANNLKLVFEFDINGLVNIEKVMQNGKILKITHIKKFQKFTIGQLNQFQVKQKQMALNDLKYKKLYQKKNQFQAIIYSVRDQIQKTFSSQQYKDFVFEKLSQGAKKLIQQNQEWVYSQQSQKIEEYEKKTVQIRRKSKEMIEAVRILKQSHSEFQKQLQTFGNWLNKIVSQRKQVPEQVNQIGEWLNQVMKKFNEQPKYEKLPVSIEELKQTAHKVQMKLKEFDEQEQKRYRQNYQNQNNYGRPQTQFRSQQSSANTFGRPQFQPRSTRNANRNNNNNNSFGRGLFDGFSGFF